VFDGWLWSWNPQVLTVFRLSVALLWPAARKLTALISRQSPWSGCGSEFISCGRLSLLTNVTREPGATVMSRGETPFAVMVMVVEAVGVPGDGEGVGELGLLPPPHATARAVVTVAAMRARFDG
jgi:hypothetical protein